MISRSGANPKHDGVKITSCNQVVVKGSNRRQQLSSQQKRYSKYPLKIGSSIMKTPSTNSASRATFSCWRSLPPPALGFSALQSGQSKTMQRGAVAQVPPVVPASCSELKGCPATRGADGRANTIAVASMDMASSASPLPDRDISFGMNQKDKCYLK